MIRIRNCHQDVWGHDHKIIMTEQKHAVVEDCTSFEMRRMTTGTDQLLSIAEATGSKFIPGSQRQRLLVQQRPWSCP